MALDGGEERKSMQCLLACLDPIDSAGTQDLSGSMRGSIAVDSVGAQDLYNVKGFHCH